MLLQLNQEYKYSNETDSKMGDVPALKITNLN